MPRKIKILGRPLIEGTQPLESEYNRIEKSFSLDSNRGTAEVIDIGAQEGDIISLEFEDGGEWIGHIDDIHQIFGEHIQLRGADDIFPGRISSSQSDRGFKEIGIKILNLIRGKKSISQTAARVLAEQFDKKKMPEPGLFRVSYKGTLSKIDFENKPENFLLFLHGTASSFHSSFDGIYEDDANKIPQAIQESYANKVIALQHYTLSKSPWDNAIEILRQLPKGSSLDIISHSRGGLIADILACCDPRNEMVGYSADDISMIRKSDESLAKSLEVINALAKKKEIKVNKVIRVACPGRGTSLLGRSLDHYLNGILRAIGLAFGGPASEIYKLVRGFLTDIISARLTPDVMPGILAMVPESEPQNLLNRTVSLRNQLIVIEGDSEVGAKFWRSVLVIFSNLYYSEGNDFVVNTSSMRYGALRESGLQFFRSQDDTTSHFNYFKNRNTREALLDAVRTPPGQPIPRFEQRSSGEINRGVYLDLFKKYKPISYDEISGKKPIVILIPGVMGTHLRVGNEIVWLDLGEIGKGRIVTDLSPDKTDIDTTYIIGQFYEDLVKFLKPTHDVYTFGYDWRLSLALAASRLDEKISELSDKAPGQPISIIAHSMGGLVVRDLMRLHQNNWAQYIKNKDSRVVLLGTPWLGSHLIMEVFTGHQSRVRQLNLMDTRHNRNELISIFNQYPGLYDLLPINQESFEESSFWEKINQELGEQKVLIPPLLNYFKNYKSQVKSFDSNADLTNVYYLAGKDEATTCTFRIARNIFGRRLQYLGIPEGDGSVTWELGIPKKLSGDNLYYAHQTIHGDLANDETLFEGIRDLIQIGQTTNLEKTKPNVSTDRSITNDPVYFNMQVMPEIAVSNRADEAFKILQGQKVVATKFKSKDQYIDVCVVHGDLKIAKHPVMVGHFKDDGITNAEAVIDYYFDGKLRDRHRISHYPGVLGESLVLYDPNKSPNGTIVIGLGEVTKLTPYHLRKSVESGILRYALHFRDNVVNHPGIKTGDQESSISCLCIGTGYGNLTMESSMNAIISGVLKANQIIDSLNSLKPIKNIEFIELYEHIAQNAYYQLSQLKLQNTANLTFRLKEGISKQAGAKRKFQFSQENSWWHNLTSRVDTKNNIPCIEFTSASGIARVEVENTFTSKKIIHGLLDQMAFDKGSWNKEYSKTLFEILIPNPFKDILRHQNNILWKMDVETAAYPWELFHDYEEDIKPTFVRAGLIRQLYTRADAKPDIIHNQSALVIADPLYSSDGPGQLPGANAEGRRVDELLRNSKIQTTALIKKPGLEIINQLINDEYKILHIAGHGTFSDNTNETGIVLDNGMYITAGFLKNMSRLPEFVFINCCYSGTIEAGKEKLYRQRFSFAANVGTQLIDMGVHAVVVAGWPVNDDAALLFAETLYTKMLSGNTFGDAVRSAREACWGKYEYTNNTWGAYQCYGDQWYRLVPDGGGSNPGKTYFTKEQVLIDLYNLRSETQDHKSEPKDLEKKLKTILQNADEAKFIDSPILELKAEILSELNLIDQAIEAYKILGSLSSEFTVKSLEQYCNLRAKQILLKVKPDPKPKLSEINKCVNDFLKDFEYLLKIGDTSERLNILGSAHKKFATAYYALDNNSSLVKEHLEKALDYYKQADQALSSNLRARIYPLTNILILEAILSTGKSQKTTHRENAAKKIIAETKKALLKETGQYMDFWEDINLINLLECELFYATENEIKSIQNEIIRLYTHAWRMSGTMRHKQAEMEQLDLVEMGVNILIMPLRWKKNINKVIGEIRKELDALS